METLIKDFEDITLMKLFEIKVINTKTKETDFIIFNISVNKENNTLIAQHVALNEEEENSNKIAFKSIDLDDCFTIDENLEELYSECIEAIIRGDFYDLE